jgi:hypothetical protein
VALGLVPATAEEQAALAAIHKKRREEREAEYAATAVATIIAVSPALGAGADMGDQERSFSSWRSPASSDMPPVVPGSPRFPEDFRRVTVCHLVKERIGTHNGHAVFRTLQSC